MAKDAQRAEAGWLAALELVPPQDAHGHPWTIPALKTLRRLNLHPRVTFLIGDNGSGKSTLMEGLAMALHLNPEGGSGSLRTNGLGTESMLWKHLRPERGSRGRPRHAYFFRAETMFALFAAAKADVAEMRAAMARGEAGYDTWGSGWLGREQRSHGESHFDVFTTQMSDGLYLLDEPESALSLDRQMSLLTRMHDLCTAGAQLIVATHSPILLAYPDSDIWTLDDRGLTRTRYEDCKPYRLMRQFVEHRQRIVAELMAD